MLAAALPQPTTRVRPFGGFGRYAGSDLSGSAAAIAASNMARSRDLGSIVIKPQMHSPRRHEDKRRFSSWSLHWAKSAIRTVACVCAVAGNGNLVISLIQIFFVSSCLRGKNVPGFFYSATAWLARASRALTIAE